MDLFCQILPAFQLSCYQFRLAGVFAFLMLNKQIQIIIIIGSDKYQKYQQLMKVKTDDNCLHQYDKLKFGKDTRYITYVIKEEKIVVQKVGGKAEKWNDFIQSLPSKQFRFSVYDFEFTNADNMAISKIIFINWSPDDTPIKGRMLYATAKQAFKGYLNLNTKDYTLGSKTDYTQQQMIKQLSK